MYYIPITLIIYSFNSPVRHSLIMLEVVLQLHSAMYSRNIENGLLLLTIVKLLELRSKYTYTHMQLG